MKEIYITKDDFVKAIMNVSYEAETNERGIVALWADYEKKTMYPKVYKNSVPDRKNSCKLYQRSCTGQFKDKKEEAKAIAMGMYFARIFEGVFDQIKEQLIETGYYEKKYGYKIIIVGDIEDKNDDNEE